MARQNFKHFGAISRAAFFRGRAAKGAGRGGGVGSVKPAAAAFSLKTDTFLAKSGCKPVPGARCWCGAWRRRGQGSFGSVPVPCSPPSVCLGRLAQKPCGSQVKPLPPLLIFFFFYCPFRAAGASPTPARGAPCTSPASPLPHRCQTGGTGQTKGPCFGAGELPAWDIWSWSRWGRRGGVGGRQGGLPSRGKCSQSRCLWPRQLSSCWRQQRWMNPRVSRAEELWGHGARPDLAPEDSLQKAQDGVKAPRFSPAGLSQAVLIYFPFVCFLLG